MSGNAHNYDCVASFLWINCASKSTLEFFFWMFFCLSLVKMLTFHSLSFTIKHVMWMCQRTNEFHSSSLINKFHYFPTTSKEHVENIIISLHQIQCWCSWEFEMLHCKLIGLSLIKHWHFSMFCNVSFIAIILLLQFAMQLFIVSHFSCWMRNCSEDVFLGMSVIILILLFVNVKRNAIL